MYHIYCGSITLEHSALVDQAFFNWLVWVIVSPAVMASCCCQITSHEVMSNEPLDSHTDKEFDAYFRNVFEGVVTPAVKSRRPDVLTGSIHQSSKNRVYSSQHDLKEYLSNSNSQKVGTLFSQA